MNLYFKDIEIENFRSIEHIKLQLSNQGIVIVKGVNEYEETASSNGSGKSSMFEAIIFALFEETSSGEKDVENRIVKNGYKIDLKFNVDEVEYEVIRQLKNNKTTVTLYKNNEDISARNKTDTNKLILNILGISKDVFLDSILLSQNVNTNLASLTPTARKERLELLTSTNQIIDEFKETLKQKQLYYENLRVTDVNEINVLTGKKQSLEQQISSLQNKIWQIEQEQREKLLLGTPQDIENEIKDKQNEIEGLEEEIITIKNESEPIQKQCEEYNNKQLIIREESSKLSLQLSDLNEQLSYIKSNINKHNIDISYKQQDINKLLKNIDDIKNSDTCPTCGRKYENFDDSHIQQTIQKYNEDIQKLQQEQEICKTDIDKLQQEQQTIEEQIELQKLKINDKDTECLNLNQQTNDLLKTLDNMNTIKDTNNDRIQILNRQIQQLKDKKQELEKELNEDKKQEYTKIIDDISIQVSEIQKQMEELSIVAQQNSDYVEVCKNSIQLVTKEFRTYLLANSINYLNNLLEKYSKDLFSNNKDVINIKEDDTKLNITLGNATYESLSGGEKTRVDIALLLAQKSLASTIGNISSNLIILDEVLKYCDGTTEINIIDLVVKELDMLESIYMISHKEIPIGYDNQLIVTKNEKGLSYIV